MDIHKNKNFKSVELSDKRIKIKDLLNEELTGHLENERKIRFDMAVELNKHKNGSQAFIDKVFLVDKGHPDGPELHCVTEKGIIFILNESKYENNTKCFITVLLARPNQVVRLYKACNLEVPRCVLNGAFKNQLHKINN